MIKLMKEYTYEQICFILHWRVCKGNDSTKIKQMEEIKRCYEYYHPVNSKTKKEKKSFIFTKKLNEINLTDGRIDNGGKRDDSGRLTDIDFRAYSYLFTYYFVYNVEESKIFWEDDKPKIYFNKKEFVHYMGWTINVYKIFDYYDDAFDYGLDDFIDIVYHKVDYYTVNQLKKFGTIGKSVQYYNENNELVYNDKMLSKYKKVQASWISSNKLSNIRNVIANHKYQEMKEFIKVNMKKVDLSFNGTDIEPVNYIILNMTKERFIMLRKQHESDIKSRKNRSRVIKKKLSDDFIFWGNEYKRYVRTVIAKKIENSISDNEKLIDVFDKFTTNIYNEYYDNLDEMTRTRIVDEIGEILNFKKDFEDYREYNILGLDEDMYTKKVSKIRDFLIEE